jgi:hypothetical protein
VLLSVLILLAQCLATEMRAPGGVVLGTPTEVYSGYLLDVRNGPVSRMTLDPDGQLTTRYLRVDLAYQGGTFWAINTGGFAFTSARHAGDGSADFSIITADARAGAMLEGRAGGYPGNVVWSLGSDGAVRAGRQGGEGAFVDVSGVGDPLGNGGPPALACRYGSGGGCYLLLAGRMANNSMHGVLTVANFEHRDAGTGLMMQVVSREGRADSVNADGNGQRTVTTISDRGDLKLWGGTVSPYFSGEPPPCSAAADDGRSGPHAGAIAWSGAAGALVVCDGYGHWRRVLTEAQ